MIIAPVLFRHIPQPPKRQPSKPSSCIKRMIAAGYIRIQVQNEYKDILIKNASDVIVYLQPFNRILDVGDSFVLPAEKVYNDLRKG